MQLSDEFRAFLAAPRFAVIATINPDGSPQQTVIWYELQGDEIMMNTAAGRVKTRNLERDPRVSFCVEDGYRYLTITGRATLNDDQAVAQADNMVLARRYMTPAEYEPWIERFQRQQRVTVRLTIETLVAYGFEE
ncbi:MAG TPA: PPOX class F420-dependent oxidoreductase [Herpetosiphonaceae bacterium]